MSLKYFYLFSLFFSHQFKMQKYTFFSMCVKKDLKI